MYHVMDEVSPAAAWLKLESRYMSKSLSNKLYLKQKLYGLKMEVGSDLSQHINVFNQLISDLMRVDVKFADEDKALMLLNSLPSTDAYENLVTTLTWGKESLKLEDVTGALLGFHHRKKAGEGSSKDEGLVVDRGRSKNRDGLGNQKSRSKSRKKKVQCWRCGKEGHIKKDCKTRKGKGKRDDSDSSSSDDNNAAGNFVSAVNSDDTVFCVTNGMSGGWILDSGCFFHMSPIREDFTSYQVVDAGKVKMGNGNECAIIGEGTVKIKMHDGVVRTLTGVKHVPELRHGLISLGALDSKGCRCSLGGGVLKVVQGALVIMKGKMVGGVYRLLGEVVKSLSSRKPPGSGPRFGSEGSSRRKMSASDRSTQIVCTNSDVDRDKQLMSDKLEVRFSGITCGADHGVKRKVERAIASVEEVGCRLRGGTSCSEVELTRRYVAERWRVREPRCSGYSGDAKEMVERRAKSKVAVGSGAQQVANVCGG